MSGSWTHSRKAGRGLLAAACVAGVLLIPAAHAAPGALDPSFGQGGKVTTTIGLGYEGAKALAVQPDGKIVVVGYSSSGSNNDFALARYNPNGSLDTSFSGDGKQTTDFGRARRRRPAVALQADGKIVAVGAASTAPTATSRSPATTRTARSTRASPATASRRPTSARLRRGERGGAPGATARSSRSAAASGVSCDFALARYNPNGSLDTSFSGDGKQTTDFGGGDDAANGVAIQADGKIVAVGDSVRLARRTSRSPATTRTARSTRASPATASRRPTSGRRRRTAPTRWRSRRDGKIVVGRRHRSGSESDFALARYNPNGSARHELLRRQGHDGLRRGQLRARGRAPA